MVAFNDFYAVARAAPSLIIWGGNACAVADPGFFAGFPDWLLDGFKKPGIVGNAEELMLFIARS
jgi:hypothetical protein